MLEETGQPLFMGKTEARIIEVFQADPRLVALARTIEQGYITPATSKEIATKFDYIGVWCEAFGEDRSTDVYYVVSDLTIRCEILTVNVDQRAAQRRCQHILSTLHKIVGEQRAGDRFLPAGPGVPSEEAGESAGSEIGDVFPGAGRIVELFDRDDENQFMVQGDYTFRVEFRLDVQIS